MQFRDIERAMTVSADVFHLGPAQLQHLAPGARLNGHTQAPQAYAAAVTLIQNGEVKDTDANEKNYAGADQVKQIVRVIPRLAKRPQKIQSGIRRPHSTAGEQKLCGQQTPIAHELFDTFRHSKVPKSVLTAPESAPEQVSRDEQYVRRPLC